jgi:hypothetical protein
MRSVIKHRQIVEDRWQAPRRRRRPTGRTGDRVAGPLAARAGRCCWNGSDPVGVRSAEHRRCGRSCRRICRCWRSGGAGIPQIQPTAAPTRRPGCCGSAMAIEVKSGRWAMCCAINCSSWRAAASTLSRFGQIAVWRMHWLRSTSSPTSYQPAADRPATPVSTPLYTSGEAALEPPRTSHLTPRTSRPTPHCRYQSGGIGLSTSRFGTRFHGRASRRSASPMLTTTVVTLSLASRIRAKVDESLDRFLTVMAAVGHQTS